MEPNFLETNPIAALVGLPINRVDGHAKVTGQATYSAEYTLPGLVHAVLKTSDVARGRITGFDTSAVGRVPGVLAILTHHNLPKLAVTPNTPEGKQAIGAAAQDDLAYQVGLDPLQIRLLNYADKDSSNGKPWSSKSLKQCYQRGAELFGWSKRNPKNGQTRQGHLLVGWGMATGSYPVHNGQGNARVRLFADGHALVQASATDLGTGIYTVITQVAADALGVSMERVRFELGDSRLPSTVVSGGSMAAGTVSSSVYLAVQDVWQKLIKITVLDAQSPLYRAQPTDVELVKGRMQLKANPR